MDQVLSEGDGLEENIFLSLFLFRHSSTAGLKRFCVDRQVSDDGDGQQRVLCEGLAAVREVDQVEQVEGSTVCR